MNVHVLNLYNVEKQLELSDVGGTVQPPGLPFLKPQLSGHSQALSILCRGWERRGLEVLQKVTGHFFILGKAELMEWHGYMNVVFFKRKDPRYLAFHHGHHGDIMVEEVLVTEVALTPYSNLVTMSYQVLASSTLNLLVTLALNLLVASLFVYTAHHVMMSCHSLHPFSTDRLELTVMSSPLK